MKLSPTEIYRDRKIFLIGSTGFLGKVTLSMLLHRFPSVGKIYLTVRARSQEESETRFWNNIITAPPFDPLRERYGSALEGFLKDVKRLGRASDVAVMLFTEFGRRVAQNQSEGTDHGTATPMYLVGAPVKGGIYGQYPSLDTLDENGDLLMTTVLRILRHTDIIAARPALKAYQDRGEARPAFQKALADQLRAFEPIAA